MWQNFAGPPIGSPLNPAQLCCQVAAVYRDSNGCLSAQSFCSLAEYWLSQQQTLQVTGPALCLRFCCAWIIEFFYSDFCCYHPLARHTQSQKPRAPIWAARLSPAVQNLLHAAPLSNKSSVFCVSIHYVRTHVTLSAANYLPSRTTCTPPSHRCSSTILFAVFRRVHKISENDCQLRLVRPSVRMEQLGSNCMDFHEILYLNIFRKPLEKNQFTLKPDKNNGYFTWRPMHILNFFIHGSVHRSMNQ